VTITKCPICGEAINMAVEITEYFSDVEIEFVDDGAECKSDTDPVLVVSGDTRFFCHNHHQLAEMLEALYRCKGFENDPVSIDHARERLKQQS